MADECLSQVADPPPNLLLYMIDHTAPENTLLMDIKVSQAPQDKPLLALTIELADKA